MTEAVCSQKGPYLMELEAGTYWWCACGKSVGQPFCDGSHAGTTFFPVKMDLKQAEKVALCGCRRTGTPPRCDGTHETL